MLSQDNKRKEYAKQIPSFPNKLPLSEAGEINCTQAHFLNDIQLLPQFPFPLTQSPTVSSESRSLTNCPEQRQIPTITTEPIPTIITKLDPVLPGLVYKLNLPLIESPKSIDNIERKDQHDTLKTPFWQGRLGHPTRHRTNSQVRMNRSVNGTYQRMKTTTNEWERYLRYVSQTIRY